MDSIELLKRLARSPIMRAIYEELKEEPQGITTAELHERLGGDRRHLARRMKELRELDAVYVGQWIRQKNSSGDYSPCFRIKTNPAQRDARRPQPITKAESAKRQREKKRAIFRVRSVVKSGLAANPFGQLAGFIHRPTGVRQAVAPDVIKLFKGGMNLTKIARELCVSQHTVSKVLQEHGLREPKPMIRREEVRSRIYAMADAGITQTEIASAIGSSRLFIYHVLRERPERPERPELKKAA